MAEKWNSETTIKFLQHLKEHECLWNTKLFHTKTYKCRQHPFRKLWTEDFI